VSHVGPNGKTEDVRTHPAPLPSRLEHQRATVQDVADKRRSSSGENAHLGRNRLRNSGERGGQQFHLNRKGPKGNRCCRCWNHPKKILLQDTVPDHETDLQSASLADNRVVDQRERTEDLDVAEEDTSSGFALRLEQHVRGQL
jgi:hypothetical protein